METRQATIQRLTESRIERLATDVSSMDKDQDFIPRESLDLRKRERTSLYPWRGQFSPGLIDLFLGTYARKGSVVLDPFVGSGTTLFESIRRGLACLGAEINPAAFCFARMARFAKVDEPGRRHVLARADRLVDRYVRKHMPINLFADGEVLTGDRLLADVQAMLRETGSDELEYSLLITSMMLAMGEDLSLTAETFLRAYRSNRSTVSSLPYSSNICEVFLTDARKLPLGKGVIDLIVTSPPYINVFNYHQNFRRAMEFIGWRPLEAAPSEIGSNRKHRGNRFLTVVQYSMDMLQVLLEMRRVLKPNGSVVIVVGRESNVRGVSFKNGHLIGMLAMGGAGLRLVKWQERRFTNRFGQSIYEDLLTLAPNHNSPTLSVEFARMVGLWTLRKALAHARDEAAAGLDEALNQGGMIHPSPMFVHPDVFGSTPSVRS